MKKFMKISPLALILLPVFVLLGLVFFNGTWTNGASGSNLKIYYHRFDGIYTGWGIHVWNDGAFAPVAWDNYPLFEKTTGTTLIGGVTFNHGEETLGGKTFRYIEFLQPGDVDSKGVKFIIHKGNDKDMGGGDQIWPSPTTNRTIGCIQSDSTIYTDQNEAVTNATNDIVTAKFTSTSVLSYTIRMTKLPAETIKVLENGVDITGTLTDSLTGTSGTFSGTYDFSKVYTVQFESRTPKIALPSQAMIESNMVPSNLDTQLGAIWNGGGNVTFRIWAPLATDVKLNFYDNWDDDNSTDKTVKGSLIKNMTANELGIWEISLGGVPNGQLYQYEIYFGETMNRVLDPYAKSMARFNSGSSTDQIGKGAVIDPATTNPAGWSDGTYHNWSGKREDAVIYEVHVRDLTIGLASGELSGKQPGTYDAFIEKLPYIQSLGVTHIQLMPVLSYFYGNENSSDIVESASVAGNCNYNWGYDPHNYFSPEGMYATKSADTPVNRVKELKKLIKAIHDHGMAVTLDVVYNHTSIVSIFENIVPGYYYRYTDTGGYKSNSGCGNDTESTNKMFRKLMKDSLKYWVDEYNVDGFRFDLMGLHDTVTITEAYNACKILNNNVLFVGEGWKMYNGPTGTTGATQDWMNSTSIVSVFNDDIRNVVKNGYPNDGKPAFLTGKSVDMTWLFGCIKGQPVKNFTIDEPGDSVNYIEAHDNLTLHDVIVNSMNLDPDNATDKANIYKRLKLGNTLLFTSQGLAFMHAGQEMGRTKRVTGTVNTPDKVYTNTKGIVVSHDSYDSSDAVNQIDWDLVASGGDGENLKDYTKGLISIRKSTDAFRLGTKTLVDSNVTRF